MHLSQRRDHDTAEGMNGAVKRIYRSTNTIICLISIIAQKSCIWQRILFLSIRWISSGVSVRIRDQRLWVNPAQHAVLAMRLTHKPQFDILGGVKNKFLSLMAIWCAVFGTGKAPGLRKQCPWEIMPGAIAGLPLKTPNGVRFYICSDRKTGEAFKQYDSTK